MLELTVLIVGTMLGFPVVFAAMWVGVTGLLGVVSGWASLREAHPDPGPDPVRWHAASSATLGWVRYRGWVLSLGASKEGLHLRTMFLFAVGQRPLRIPWSLVDVGELENFLLLVRREVRLGASRVVLRLPDATWAEIEKDAAAAGAVLRAEAR